MDVKIKSQLLTMFLLLTPNLVYAQRIDAKVALSYLGYNPFRLDADTSIAKDIDKILFACDGLGKTTMGEIECYYMAIQATERKIRIAYNQLYKKLDSSDKKRLQKTQLKWDAYFKAESDFLDNSFNAAPQKYGHGREHAIAHVEWLFKIARQRLIAIRVFSHQIY